MDESSFRNLVRMDYPALKDLVSCIEFGIIRVRIRQRQLIDGRDHLPVTLRFLATGGYAVDCSLYSYTSDGQ